MPKKTAPRKVKEVVTLSSATRAPFRGSFEASITSKGQIVIPASLRRKFGITPQTRIVIYEEGQQIVLKPITPHTIRQLHGSLKGSGMVKALLEERSEEREREEANSRLASNLFCHAIADWN